MAPRQEAAFKNAMCKILSWDRKCTVIPAFRLIMLPNSVSSWRISYTVAFNHKVGPLDKRGEKVFHLVAAEVTHPCTPSNRHPLPPPNSPQVLSARCAFFLYCINTPVVGKARRAIVWLGGTVGRGQQPTNKRTPCCDSCRAVSLICGHSCSLAAFVVHSVCMCVCVRMHWWVMNWLWQVM